MTDDLRESPASDWRAAELAACGLTPFALELIQRKARRLSRQPGFCKDERDDLAQTLALHLLERHRAYVAERGPYAAFVTVVVRHKVASMIRQRRAQRRDDSATVPLGPLAMAIAAPPPSEALDNEAHRDLALDMAESAETMSPLQRRICAALGRLGAAGAARELGLSRHALYRELALIRARCQQAGLDRYLPDSFCRVGVVNS